MFRSMMRFAILLGCLPQFQLIATGEEPIPTFLDVARGSEGKVLLMTQGDAAQYCACDSEDARSRLGCSTAPGRARLPSVRELAQFSVHLGAKGFMNKSACGFDRSCWAVTEIRNADGSDDEFHFNISGYRPSDDELRFHDFWSSSRRSVYPYGFFLLDGHYAFFITESRHFNRGAVLCVSSNSI